jgi:uncharacterized protein
MRYVVVAGMMALSLAGPAQAADTISPLTTALAEAVAHPVADHHQHLFSPAISELLSTKDKKFPILTSDDIVKLLDAAGIQRAVLLSVAYMYGSPSRTVENEYAKVKAENDWTAAQAAAYPDRLRAFCSFNPMKEYALQELKRCAQHPGLKHGIKLHVGNSDVQLDNPDHLAKLQEVFRAANANRMAIAVHLRASISRKRPYGPEQARIFLKQLMPLTPDIPVQIAHLAGAGPGYGDTAADEVMGEFAAAVERKDPHARGLWFDVASMVNVDISEEQAALVVKRLRQIGVDRVLYGTDAAVGDNLRPKESWNAFRRLPLRDEEFKRIANNVAPYLR